MLVFGGCNVKPFHSPNQWQVFQGIAQQHEAQREGAEIDMEESTGRTWIGFFFRNARIDVELMVIVMG